MVSSSEWLAFMLLKKLPLDIWQEIYPNCLTLFNIILIVEPGRAPQAFRQEKINIKCLEQVQMLSYSCMCN